MISLKLGLKTQLKPMDKLNVIFSNMDDLLTDDRKDMLQVTVAALKKNNDQALASEWQKQMLTWSWELSMTQHLCTSASTSLQKGPMWWNWQQRFPLHVSSSITCQSLSNKQEVRELIMAAFDNLSKAHAHMNSYAANIIS